MVYKISVKAFILNPKKELLLIKRKESEIHAANEWEIPGGRLEEKESIEEGLKREVKEEAGIDVNVLFPLKIKHYIREDKQKIATITFLCTTKKNQEIKLSSEHSEHKWLNINKVQNEINKYYIEDIEIIKNNFL